MKEKWEKSFKKVINEFTKQLCICIAAASDESKTTVERNNARIKAHEISKHLNTFIVECSHSANYGVEMLEIIIEQEQDKTHYKIRQEG